MRDAGGLRRPTGRNGREAGRRAAGLVAAGLACALAAPAFAQQRGDISSDAGDARTDAMFGMPNQLTPAPLTNLYATSPDLEAQIPAPQLTGSVLLPLGWDSNPQELRKGGSPSWQTSPFGTLSLSGPIGGIFRFTASAFGEDRDFFDASEFNVQRLGGSARLQYVDPNDDQAFSPYAAIAPRQQWATPVSGFSEVRTDFNVGFNKRFNFDGGFQRVAAAPDTSAETVWSVGLTVFGQVRDRDPRLSSDAVFAIPSVSRVLTPDLSASFAIEFLGRWYERDRFGEASRDGGHADRDHRIRDPGGAPRRRADGEDSRPSGARRPGLLSQSVVDRARRDLRPVGGAGRRRVRAGARMAVLTPTRTKRAFPAPVTILTAVLVLVWIATFFIPPGEYRRDAGGAPIAGSFHAVPAPLDLGGRVGDLLLAPINGMYGIQDPATGMVGPSNAGTMFGSVQVFLFVLSIGGFMTVVFATGALDLGIHHLAYRFRSRASLLIVILTVIFGVMGSIKGWSDETLGLYAIMVPLMAALGYDRLVTVAVVSVAPFVGAAASTINPFQTGIASSKAGVSIADGMGLQLVLLALTLAATAAYTLWYANRVKADPTKSLCVMGAEDAELARADTSAPPPLSGTHLAVIGVVIFTFALLAFSILPWGAFLGPASIDPETGAAIRSPVSWELGWWLPELAALFFVMTIVAAVVGRLGEGEAAKAFVKGVADFAGPAFLITLARSVSVVMTNTRTIDTVLHAMEGLVAGPRASGSCS